MPRRPTAAALAHNNAQHRAQSVWIKAAEAKRAAAAAAAKLQAEAEAKAEAQAKAEAAAYNAALDAEGDYWLGAMLADD